MSTTTEQLAREAGLLVPSQQLDGTWVLGPDQPTARARFEALVRADERERCIAKIQRELDHAAINDHRLEPSFGKQRGDPAVRASSIEAALDAIRSSGAEGET
jgi:prophage tail gpP-like protein